MCPLICNITSHQLCASPVSSMYAHTATLTHTSIHQLHLGDLQVATCSIYQLAYTLLRYISSIYLQQPPAFTCTHADCHSHTDSIHQQPLGELPIAQSLHSLTQDIQGGLSIGGSKAKSKDRQHCQDDTSSQAAGHQRQSHSHFERSMAGRRMHAMTMPYLRQIL